LGSGVLYLPRNPTVHSDSRAEDEAKWPNPTALYRHQGLGFWFEGWTRNKSKDVVREAYGREAEGVMAADSAGGDRQVIFSPRDLREYRIPASRGGMGGGFWPNPEYRAIHGNAGATRGREPTDTGKVNFSNQSQRRRRKRMDSHIRYAVFYFGARPLRRPFDKKPVAASF